MRWIRTKTEPSPDDPPLSDNPPKPDRQVPDAERVAERWSEIADEFSPQTYWLGHPRVVERYHRRAVGGKPFPHWVNYCVLHYLGEEDGRILTVGCGDGELERHILALRPAYTIDAIDISAQRIETARRRAEEAGLDQVTYHAADAEVEPFPGSGYAAVFFDSSFHHLDDLEGILAKTSAVLEPDGLIFFNEYAGPNRFDLSPRERELLQSAFLLIPDRYRRSLSAPNYGELMKETAIPDPLDVAEQDPSEAIRSADIPEVVRAHFEVLEHNDIGGSLLQYALMWISGNFREDDPEAMAVLDLLFQIEDTLMETGEIGSHFVLIVARNRKPSASAPPVRNGSAA